MKAYNLLKLRLHTCMHTNNCVTKNCGVTCVTWNVRVYANLVWNFLACVASVSVEFGSKERPRNGVFGILPARKMWREPKKERWGYGRGRKEPLADKPLDFENPRSLANGAHDWLG